MRVCAGWYLLLLGSAATGALGRLDGLLVALGRAALETAHEAGGLLEGALEVAGRGLAEEVDLGEVGLESTLERDDALDEERIGVLEVEMHDAHHEDAHHLRAHQLLELAEIVVLDSGGNELGLLCRAHRCRLNIFEGGEV